METLLVRDWVLGGVGRALGAVLVRQLSVSNFGVSGATSFAPSISCFESYPFDASQTPSTFQGGSLRPRSVKIGLVVVEFWSPMVIPLWSVGWVSAWGNYFRLLTFLLHPSRFDA